MQIRIRTFSLKKIYSFDILSGLLFCAYDDYPALRHSKHVSFPDILQKLKFHDDYFQGKKKPAKKCEGF